jgi:hypothetical protein
MGWFYQIQDVWLFTWRNWKGTGIFMMCILLCVIYKIYDIYNRRSLHNSISQKKTNETLWYQHLFIRYRRNMFRPLHWVIIRHMIIQALVLELHFNAIWIHIVSYKLIYIIWITVKQ